MIEVNGLTKIYDGFRAVDNVDLVAKRGKSHNLTWTKWGW